MKEKMDKNLDKDMLAIMNGIDKLVGKQNRVGNMKEKDIKKFIKDREKIYTDGVYRASGQELAWMIVYDFCIKELKMPMKNYNISGLERVLFFINELKNQKQSGV